MTAGAVMTIDAKERRDEAERALRQATLDHNWSGTAVDAIIAACIAKINQNLKEELTQIRALVGAGADETTYRAVKRLYSERTGLQLKYKEHQEVSKEIISDLKMRIKGLERELRAKK
jgi:hypothetical protein